MLLTIIVSPLNVRLHAGPPARVEDERPGAISAIASASRLHVGLAGSAGVCWPDCSAFDVGAPFTRGSPCGAPEGQRSAQVFAPETFPARTTASHQGGRSVGIR